MREFRVYGAFVSVEKFHTFSLRIFGETSHIIMALQADQLMRGLQLDDASMQKLELDMREEVRARVFFVCVLCSFAVIKVLLFSLRV